MTKIDEEERERLQPVIDESILRTRRSAEAVSHLQKRAFIFSWHSGDRFRNYYTLRKAEIRKIVESNAKKSRVEGQMECPRCDGTNHEFYRMDQNSKYVCIHCAYLQLKKQGVRFPERIKTKDVRRGEEA